MSPGLQIRLFDPFHLTYGDEPTPSITSVRGQSLLAYLLLHHDTPQPCQYLVYLLWPDSTEAQTRTNLRREIHHLRRALPKADHFLLADAHCLQWRSDAPFTLDVGDFAAAVAQVEQAEAAGNEHAWPAALETAVALYRGDLLPACYDEWIISERERLSQLFAPLLGLGMPIGLGVGQLSQWVLPGVVDRPEIFAVVGMAAYFAAIGRAPLTGVVLILEMMGNYWQLLPLITACFCA
jgi:two-component SAPR family response regulator